MNSFQKSVKKLIYRHGTDVTFTRVIEGDYDPETSQVVNTEISTSLKAYPKQIRTNQFNYPDLVNKTVVEFLMLGTDLTTEPMPLDKIVMHGETYTIKNNLTIDTYGEATLFKALSVKS